jgi:pilus assembly protein Flp/PilA
MLKKMKNLVVAEEGQALTEYGLIIALVAVAVSAGLILLRNQLNTIFTTIKTTLTSTTAGTN